MLAPQVPLWTLAVTAGGVMLVLLLGLCLARCTRRRPDSCALHSVLNPPTEFYVLFLNSPASLGGRRCPTVCYSPMPELSEAADR